MSWDVILEKKKTDSEKNDDSQIIVLKDQLSSAFGKIEWNSETDGMYENSTGCQMEISITDGDPPGAWLSIHGPGNAVKLLCKIIKKYDWAALDSSTGEYIDPKNPPSY